MLLHLVQVVTMYWYICLICFYSLSSEEVGYYNTLGVVLFDLDKGLM